jgi:hypothetical protein
MLRASSKSARRQRQRQRERRKGKHAQRAAKNDVGYDDMYREGVQQKRGRGARREAQDSTRSNCAASSQLIITLSFQPSPKPLQPPPPSALEEVAATCPASGKCKHKAPPQPTSRYGPNRLGVHGVHGDRNGDDGDAHASATFHRPLCCAALHRLCCPRCTGSAVLAANTCQHLAAL